MHDYTRPFISLDPDQWSAAVDRPLLHEGMASMIEPRRERRVIGFAGEIAACIYLTGSDSLWYDTQDRWDQTGIEQSDLWAFPTLEIKTLTDVAYTRMPLNTPYETIPRPGVDFFATRYAGGRLFEMLGWISNRASVAIWSMNLQRFRTGAPCINVDVLSPPSTCPWKVNHD